MRDHPAYAGRPEHLKIAVDGLWEEGVTVRLGQGPPNLSEVRLEGALDVACEAFFGEAFFGVRQRGTPDDMARFVQAFAGAASAAASGPKLFDALADAVGICVAAHFRYCELGAEGAWKSVGPLRIEDPVAALTDTDELWSRVGAASVGRDTAHPKALEFTFANTAPDPDAAGPVDETTHWFALPVSHGTKIDRVALEAALRAYP